MASFISWFAAVLLCFSCEALQAQGAFSAPAKKSKAQFYFLVGANRSFYSRSDVRLRGTQAGGFDFTLDNVRGKDDGLLNFGNGAPQYSYAAGYLNRQTQWGMEVNFDHVKYYAQPLQRVHLRGNISGQHLGKDTLLVPGLVQLEHTDGGNYLLVKVVKEIALFEKKQRPLLGLMVKAGGGPVIPKTNSTILGIHRDDRYKIAGYVLALEGGIRYHLSRTLFVAANVKGAYAHYTSFLIAGGTGSQRWLGLHPAIFMGIQFPR